MTSDTFNDTYELKAVIGRGGMSAVYLAEHKRLHTNWAVKEVRKQQGAKFDFLAESNILKRLNHPMLPRIVDIFENQDCIYIVEDYVEGITLEEVLHRQPRVEESQGIQWFRDLCDVLGYLHSQEPHPIIYRDMKPSNVMLQSDGTLKLIDFGIAREYKKESSADTTYIGTKGYAAPEQFGTAQTDARTDIYSLGVTMYHLLTGKSPYEPPYQFVPARQLVPELSHGIEYILNKCIQPEPANRYQNVDEILDDLDNSYRFDKAYKRYKAVKRLRACVIVVMLAASIVLTGAGWLKIGGERETEYGELLDEAMECSADDYARTVELLDEARELYPDRADADRIQTYALYLSGAWQECVDYGLEAMERYGEDREILLAMAPAYFELGMYEEAAEGFRQGGELSSDNMRDYAVCLGRLGRTDEAQEVLAELIEQGADAEETIYVQGEVALSLDQYVEAESAFLEVLDKTESLQLRRRCYIALADLYREGAALARVGEFPIELPATKAVEILAKAVSEDGMRFDTVLWESLGLAYFDAFHMDVDAPQDYLVRAGNCFERVIELGVTKEYLYSNLYTIYYELGQYDNAAKALDDFESVYPGSFMPHALRGMLYITIENGKPQEERDYREAEEEYEKAGEKIRSSDETTYYQQLGSLIEELRKNGWL